MILLDTNVLSELMKARPQAGVIAWLNEMETTQLWLSTITIAELEYGLQVMPGGERKTMLKHRFDGFVDSAFSGRVLGFGFRPAVIYGEIMSHRRSEGRPMSVPDGQIASIALSRGLKLATRNTRDFQDCGLDLINPFK
ncbi:MULTISPECIES: type II toxin-antitoxin system VapC family toxin [unclassified Wenzhouxiangella]|uniref:type II toxin-antitoxin system VapC family toxin n=1 Tax=unclassified Wenzhouxiangella TaxID=2613841 RepID=UPI000E32BA59|nr:MULTISPECIES: type II toxin-antitoxin system VapC family toxin [unclassified Wenzhouxiangella]RFF27815.1 type II toxin-antitoxin system VapC family toxin [Wenzhouxiangella sp. 15181]RFP70342.1 type II toxin-antitoxin system VapC family toxin [Wenzhouxiangella sp. 15190]